MKKIILNVAVASLLFIGCSDDTKEQAKEVANKSIDTVAKVVEDTTTQTNQIVEQIKETTAPVVEEVAQKAKEVSQELNQKVTELATTVTKTTPNANTLYAPCAGCHGVNGEKKALNQSAIIQGWSKEKVIESLNGYKDGTYGGAMKGVMKGQVSKLSPEEINALAEHISNL